MATFIHKRGDTFALASSVENEGVAVDITNWTIESQVRQVDDTLVQNLTVTVTDAANGLFTISATALETESWPVANLFCDIEFTEVSGEVNSTETFTISVQKDITRD